MFNVAHKIMVESETFMFKKPVSREDHSPLCVCNSNLSVLKSAMSWRSPLPRAEWIKLKILY